MIDTHSHLFLKDNPFKGFDANTIFTDSINSGVEQIWLVGTNKYDNVKNIKFAKKHPKIVKCWVGFHPEEYLNFDLTFLKEILKNQEQHSTLKDSISNSITLENTLIVGIGEVGVDLHWNKKSTTKAQQMVFEDQIRLANKYNLPVSIHSRDAFEQTFEVMQKYKDTKFVWHCFNLNTKETNRVLNNFPNLYLGLNAIVTYKSGEYIWDSVKEVSVSQILIETDCPFLPPRPFKHKYNTPYGVIPVYNFVAKKLGFNVEELKNQVEKNCIRLINKYSISHKSFIK